LEAERRLAFMQSEALRNASTRESTIAERMGAIFRPMALAMQRAAGDLQALKAEAANADKRVREMERHVSVLSGTAAAFNRRFATRADKVCLVGVNRPLLSRQNWGQRAFVLLQSCCDASVLCGQLLRSGHHHS
jgi:hypothetical protein